MAGRRTIISNVSETGDKTSSITRLREKLSSQKTHRKSKRPKMSVFAAYGGVFAFIVSVIAVGYQPPQPTTASSAVVTAAAKTPASTPDVFENVSVDELVATNVAAKVAEETDMFVATNVVNLSVSLEAKVELAQTSDVGIVKPQIVQPTSSEVLSYVVQAGDTVDSIAEAHGVKAETIRWANNLVGNTVAVDRTLTIPPMDGVLYTVRAGDTIDTIASAYSASKDRITAVNNLELGGLKPGVKILVPNGNLPENQRPGYVAPRPVQSYVNYGTGFGGSSWHIKTGTPGYAGNGYAYGNCTRYAYDRRVEMGKRVGGQWGNATTWSYYAAREGYLVNNTPSVGAIIQNGGGYGHVGIVERVLPNGDIEVSEMNAYVSGGGWNKVNGRVIPSAQVRFYAYIH
jgi:surface antigen/LysM repeat protein